MFRHWGGAYGLFWTPRFTVVPYTTGTVDLIPVGFVEPRIIVLSYPVPRVATNDENDEETRRWGKNFGERNRRKRRLLYVCMLFVLV